MADRAILREPGRYVIRILRAVVIGNVAGNAFLRFPLIDSILVAVRAGKRFMTAS